jgi:hypothetical protein
MSAPFTAPPIQDLLSTSAKSVVGGCDGSGVCAVGGQNGLGEQMTALDSVLALLIGRTEEVGTPPTTSSGPAATTTAPGSLGVSRAGVDRSVILGFLFMALLVGRAFG